MVFFSLDLLEDLSGIWHVIIGEGNTFNCTISKDGRYTVVDRIFQITVSNNQTTFPTSEGWVMAFSDDGKEWSYIRLSNGCLYVYHFSTVKEHPKIYKDLPDYCCRGNGTMSKYYL